MNSLHVPAMNSPLLIYRYVTEIFPMVKQELKHWQKLAAQIPDDGLRQQALESIRTKAFHCQGGSIYALHPGVNCNLTVQFIVAYQTISDYLDNLVDSMEVQDEKAFAQLHLAMQEALDPQVSATNYYLYYPYQNDGGYLEQLVKVCQDCLSKLPSYALIKDEAMWLAKLYSSLQTFKHLAIEEREEKMLCWLNPHWENYKEITNWEFAAATGSTLGIFCLYAGAFKPNLTHEDAEKVRKVYFPWICGLHILLDYFIDLREDRETNQLNFVAYYESTAMMRKRLHIFVIHSLNQAKKLRYPKFHRAVVQGLLAMYLSDKKSTDLQIRSVTKQLLNDGGWGVKLLYWMCCRLRKLKRL